MSGKSQEGKEVVKSIAATDTDTDTDITGKEALDLSVLPPIFVFPTRLSVDELHETEDALLDRHAPLTYDATEARLFVGKVGTKRRAELELRTRGVWTEGLEEDNNKRDVHELPAGDGEMDETPPRKKKRRGERSDGDDGDERDDSLAGLTKAAASEKVAAEEESETEVESETEDEGRIVTPLQQRGDSRGLGLGSSTGSGSGLVTPTNDCKIMSCNDGARVAGLDAEDHVKVLNLQWLQTSIQERRLVDVDDYLVYKARRVASVDIAATVRKQDSGYGQSDTTNGNVASTPPVLSDVAKGILERARMDAENEGKDARQERTFTHGPRKLGRRGRGAEDRFSSHSVAPKTTLLQRTTSDNEEEATKEIPQPPDWVKEQRLYSCERSTPFNSPNEAFVDELKKIRLARILTEDEIGVRAYSTSIASVAAYPYKIRLPREIIALPGCDVKIANLWIEWTNNDGVIEAVRDAENDETLKTLRIFYNIWGVGATTAREFYNQGWRDLDDIVEHGWNTLTRVQQIGVKYYDEFNEPIPRHEVEAIGRTIHEAAVRARDDGIETCIVGGHRRGKSASGDVDVIVSHRRFEATANLVTDIVAELETSGHVTHTLLLSLAETERGQATLPYRSGNAAGHGFDSLDKALLVWQDPSSVDGVAKSEVRVDDAITQEKKGEGEEQHNHKKTTKHASKISSSSSSSTLHRRVDIIISPWRTVGCAVLGWSGGTTFQRDLRRYARTVKGWKFDSSGIRDRATGMVMNLEGEDGVGKGLGMEDAERKVFEGLGLTYREPRERCTG